MFEFYGVLDENEKIIWMGKPKCHHLMAEGEFYLIPIKLYIYTLLVASAVFRTNYTAALGMMLIGFYECGGYLLHKLYIRKRLVYVITNQRVFIFYKQRPQSITYPKMEHLDKIIYPDGYGDILFVERSHVWGRHFMLSVVWRELYDELVCVNQVEKLYKVIHDYHMMAK